MKRKHILILLLLVGTMGWTTDETEVYICVSKTADKYHYTKTCRGLKKCTHTISKIRLKEAQKMGRELCGFEK